MSHETISKIIVIVDHAPEELTLLTWLLTQHGYQVHLLAEPHAVLAAVRDLKPALIVLELTLPAAPDAYELCRRLKAAPQTRDIPVLFLSALRETTYKVRAFEAGGADYLAKPFQPEEVVARVQTHLRLRRCQQQTKAREARLRQKLAQQEEIEDALKHCNRELSMLNRVSQSFSSSLELDEVLKTALEEIQQLLQVISASFWLITNENGDLACMQAIGPGSENLVQWRLQAGQGISGWAASHNESVLALDTWEDPRHFRSVDEQTGFTVRSMITIPLCVKGNVIGILNLVDSRVNHFTPGDVVLLEPLAAAAAIAIDNARLYTAAQQEIADRKQFEVQLREAKEAAEAANRAKSMFLATMSHEFRTPLNVILGFTQLLKQRANLDADQQQDVRTISRSGEHLLTLINQVLDLSKIEAGKMALNADNVDLHCLLATVVDLFRLRAEEKGLRLSFELAPEVPQYIRTDEVKLRQVLMNLLNNAIKFTEAGEVRLRVWEVPAGSQAAQPPVDAEQILQFSVEDSGPGIDPAELESIFEAFAQTQIGHGAPEGTGLGLTISRKFVELLGGTMTAENLSDGPDDAQHGAAFRFTMPVRAVPTPAFHHPMVSRRVLGLKPGQPRYRILLVDDRPDNRLLLSKFLAPLQLDLREVGNGREAIDIWTEWQPDLIWMDVRMPTMDGYEATRQIRELEARTPHPAPRTRIIAITASSYEEEQSIALATGCDDFLRKPFKAEQIFHLLHRHLGLQYVYAASRPPSEQPDQAVAIPSLSPDDLDGLPQNVLDELLRAVSVLDVKTVHSLVNRIAEYNEPVYRTLAQLAQQYRFDLLQRVLEQQQSGKGVQS